ncbi:hypothetical protein GC207_10205 [bacterium]|nr:hypothetical protein [bacterium]
MSPIARHITALMLALTLGLHWTVLQSVAWMTMLVNYSTETSFSDAVEMTFDGQHPCKLCIAVAEGKKTERREALLKSFAKADWVLSSDVVCLTRPPATRLAMTHVATPLPLRSPPPLPPPRLLHG